MSLLTDGTHANVVLGEVVPGPLVLLTKLYENQYYNGPPVKSALIHEPVDVVRPDSAPMQQSTGLGDETSYKIHEHLKKLLNEKIANKTLLASRDWR